MAYSRQVIWRSPYSNRFMPKDIFGLQYTTVLMDVPLRRLRRDVWESNETFFVSKADTREVIIMDTSIRYEPGTLRVFGNGKPVDFTETGRLRKDRFTVGLSDIKDKYIHCAYVPGDIANAIGDTKEKLEIVYGIVTGKKYNRKLREVIELSREYIASMCEAVGIEPPLWIGGKDNTDIGIARSLIPVLTPASVNSHLVPITEKVRDLRAFAISKKTTNIPEIPEAAFTLEYFETIQEILIAIDIVLEEVL